MDKKQRWMLVQAIFCLALALLLLFLNYILYRNLGSQISGYLLLFYGTILLVRTVNKELEPEAYLPVITVVVILIGAFLFYYEKPQVSTLKAKNLMAEEGFVETKKPPLSVVVHPGEANEKATICYFFEGTREGETVYAVVDPKTGERFYYTLDDPFIQEHVSAIEAK